MHECNAKSNSMSYHSCTFHSVKANKTLALDVSGYKIKMSNEGSDIFFPPLRTFRNKHLPLVMHRMYIWYTVSFHNVSKVYKFTWNMKFIDIYYIIVMNHLIKRQPRDTMKSKNVRDVVAGCIGCKL